jgi:hypothetical protein
MSALKSQAMFQPEKHAFNSRGIDIFETIQITKTAHIENLAGKGNISALSQISLGGRGISVLSLSISISCEPGPQARQYSSPFSTCKLRQYCSPELIGLAS